MAAQALGVLLWNTDKLMLWMFATTELLGVYAIQSSFTGLILLLPTAIVSVLHPHVRYEAGRVQQKSNLPRRLISNSELVALLSAPLVCLAFLSIHIPIRWWLPAYADAIVPGRVLLIASYFSIISALHSVVLIAHSRQRELCVQRIIALFPVVGISLITIAMGLGLVGIASATTAGLLIAYSLTTTSSMRVAGYGRETVARLSVLNVVPLLIGVAALILSYEIFPADGQTLLLDVRVTILRSAVVCLCLLPWIAWRLYRSRGFRVVSPTEASIIQPKERETGDSYK